MIWVDLPFQVNKNGQGDSLQDSSASPTNKVFFSKQKGKIMKGISIFSLMASLAVLGAGSKSALAQVTITVPATTFCVDSGINVSRGDSLQFSAMGQASYGYEGSPVNSTPVTNPDGDRFVNRVNIGKKNDTNAIYKGSIGALVGKVGANGNYFLIGGRNQLSMGQSGRLFLCYNDVAGSFNNNSGSYKVSLSRTSNPNQQNTIGRSPSPSQPTPTAGRSPSPQQNPQRQTPTNGDDTIVYNNIVCTGKTRNLLGQESPASCKSKEADSRLIFNSITWERQTDRSIKVEMKVFNQGTAEAFVQIYDAQKRLVNIKIIEGNKPPTGLIDSGIDMFTRFPVSLFNQYSLTDPRKNLNEQEFSDKKKNSIIIPSGGSIKITKSSNEAFRYNAAMLSLELVLLAQGDPAFAKDETVKQFVKRFAQEAYFSRTSKATINFFKSEPSVQAQFRMDVVDPNKAAEVFKQLVEFSVSGENDPSKNPFIGAFLDVYKDVGNLGLETVLDKFILPGLGTFVKATRITSSRLNTFARGADLYYAMAAGEKATITLEDAERLRRNLN